MLTFDIKHLFPGFLLNDKNGYAMAKAIEKAMMTFCQTVQDGVDVAQDVEKMPEWRLNEMAWEMGCLYDYNADIESKRTWVRDALPLFASYGTVDALYKVLEGYFDEAEVEENWQYGGQPYHFRVTVSGEWTDANESWARKAIASAKNVRSVLDDIAVGSGTTIAVHGEGAMLAKYPYGMTEEGLLTGTIPQESIIGKSIGAVLTAAAADANGYVYPYPAAGTKPQESTIGAARESTIRTDAMSGAYRFPYQMPGDQERSGTEPQESTLGTIVQADAYTQSDGKATAFSYSPCSDVTLCGDHF